MTAVELLLKYQDRIINKELKRFIHLGIKRLYTNKSKESR